MNAYKLVNSNFRSKQEDITYQIGETYTTTDALKNGLHFSWTPLDCYDDEIKDPIILELEILGKIRAVASKYTTDKFKVLRIVPFDEIADELENKGDGNIGFYNNGDNNCGCWNKGDNNKGNLNNGISNLGSWNSGIGNIGDDNNGCYNVGNNNYGNYNKGNNIFGVFCTKPTVVAFFNQVIPVEEYQKIFDEKFEELSRLQTCIEEGVATSNDLNLFKQTIPYFNEEIFLELVEAHKHGS